MYKLVFALSMGLIACSEEVETVTTPPPGALEAGFAKERIPAPVGIGTVGYSALGATSALSPYADMFPATRNLHGHPEIKTVIISRGDAHEIVFVRLDTIGVFQQLRRDVVLRVLEQSGRDIDASLVMGGTHTHSGPGRVVDVGGLFDLIADSFLPAFYDLFVTAIVDTILRAYDDLETARIDVLSANSDTAHNDRRCEDGGPDYENGEIPLIAIERGGKIDLLVAGYAIHGTVLGIDDLTLSQDVFGAIEMAIEDGFDHPVDTLLFNTWGADMSPGDPEVARQDGTDQPDGFDQMEQIGIAVADKVHARLALGMEWDSEPTVEMSVHRPPIDRDAIGYDDDTFPYDYGAVYCQSDSDCDASTIVENLDGICIPFTEDYPAPNQTVLSAGQLGDLHLVTFPGEAGTRLAEGIIEQIQTAHPAVGQVFFLGYSQDYLGYSIEEDDWWQGGYEASGSLWGPRQGEYLAEQVVATMTAYQSNGALDSEMSPIETFDLGEIDSIVPETALSAGSILLNVAESVLSTETVTFSFAGSDPWLGTPWLRLLDEAGNEVLRPNGMALTGDDYPFHWSLSVDPSYADNIGPTERTFIWTVSLPAQHHAADWAGLSAGRYQLEILIPLVDDSTQSMTSEWFNLMID